MRKLVAVASAALFPAACAPASAPPATAQPRAASAIVSAPAPAAPAEPTSAPSVLTPAQLSRDAELIPRARAFLDAFTNGDARLARSGAVVFTSNRDGLPQLYVGDAAHPREPPRRLPTPNERVGSSVLTADERSVLFTSDTGSDGHFHIFRVGLDGQWLVDLTPDAPGGHDEPLHRDPPRIARDRPGLFAYSAHAASSERTRIFVQHEDGSPPREVYADPRGGGLVDLSPDGERALFVRSNADEDDVVFEVAMADGHARRIYPPEGQRARADAAFSARADRIFVATQREGQHAELLAIDLATTKAPAATAATARYEETLLPNGSITEIAVAPSGDRLAITLDAGNRTQVRLLDARTLKLKRTVDAPPGLQRLGAFRADGKRFTLLESNPAAPTDIFAVDSATGTVSPLRDEPRAGLPAMPPLQVSIETIPSFDGLPIPLNVYRPTDAPGGTRLPMLVSIHGGPTGSSILRWSAPTRYFASLGYAVVEPNIRGSAGFGVAYASADDKEKRGDALRDVEAVNRWARAQPWCDGDRLVIMGGSYGGYMTLLALGRQPSLWSAGLDVSGMSDLRTMEKLEDQAIRVFDETEFGVLGKDDALLKEWSPLGYVDAITAPVFVYQGAGDPITPQNEADQMVRALRRRQVPVEYMLLANEGHGITRRENLAEYLARTARFLEEHVTRRR